jgi:hypothetical protein
MTFMERSARYFLVIKAAKEFKREIEQAGLDNLKILADAGKSIVGTYLNSCSLRKRPESGGTSIRFHGWG